MAVTDSVEIKHLLIFSKKIIAQKHVFGWLMFCVFCYN